MDDRDETEILETGERVSGEEPEKGSRSSLLGSVSYDSEEDLLSPVGDVWDAESPAEEGNDEEPTKNRR